MIHDFQKQRTTGRGHYRQRADDGVVDKFTQFPGRDAAFHVGIEDLQEVPEFFLLRLFAKRLVPQQRFPVLFQVVHKRHGIKTQVRAGESFPGPITGHLAALDMVNRRAAERSRGLAGVTPVAHHPDVRRVVRAGGGRDRRILNKPSLIASCSLT